MPATILDRPGESLAEEIAALPEAQREEWLRSVPEEYLDQARHSWWFWGRPSQQIPTAEQIRAAGHPSEEWSTWLVLSGRGTGKTRTGAETIHLWTETAPRIGILGPSAGDVRDVMIEGESGVLATAKPDAYPKYEPSKRRLTWPNGCRATTFGAGEDPEELRGPQFHKAWLDEVASWQYAEDAIDNLEFGMRLGWNPQMLWTTTPKPRKVIRDIIKDPDVVITKESTYVNIAHLSPAYIRRVVKKYEGTRRGRQELYAELLDDVPGALWTRAMIDYKAPPATSMVVVAIDPSVTSEGNYAGIIGAGRGRDGHGYVLGDFSVQASPLEWGKAAILAYMDLKADRIIYEMNQGGELVAQNIRMAALALNVSTPPMTAVHASRGKRTRAEPVANLYEQHRIHHVQPFEILEDQLVNWTPDEGDSPDRLDADVWALTYLMLDQPEPIDKETAEAIRQMNIHG